MSKNLLLALMFVFGQPIVAAEAPMPPCSSEVYRQFDFWLGDWQVHAGGKLAGYNKIELAHNKCVLTESYSTPSGFSGQSLNMYDSKTGMWHQTWVDVTGNLLLLNGKLTDGKMVLSGVSNVKGGGQVINQITWTPNKDGSVRQHWQVSKLGSDSWKTIFDGIYTKKD